MIEIKGDKEVRGGIMIGTGEVVLIIIQFILPILHMEATLLI